jgi:tetratricopeptide (TPR) repeat protein
MIQRLIGLRAPVLTGVFVCAVLLLGGCATPQVAMLDARWPTELPAQVELADIPFFPQEDYECGPAALAMVAHAAGVDVTPDALVDQVYLPGRKGSLQPEMLAATRRQGLLAYPLKPKVEDILREVAAGHPVLVFQNLAFSIYPVWHYAVVMGFDRERHVLLLHSGRTARMEISLFAFERTWARGQYWAMRALKPGQLPATAEPQAYTAAAAKAYRQAVLKHPDFADGWNNLAQVLLELNRRQEASQAIARAVALGGERLPAYLVLQEKIYKK